MKILLEAHHPAHIHFWKYPVRELIERGHEVLMIGRDRDVMRRLLEVYDWIPAEIPKRRTRGNKFPLIEMLERQWVVAKSIRRFRPDVVASLMGSYTQTAKLLGVRNLIFTDSEFQHFNHRIAHPFADEIYTPACFYKDLGAKQVKYDGIHELVFLNPRVFRRDPSVLERYDGLVAGGYVLVRLSAWNTLHDLAHEGLGDRVYSFVQECERKYRVVISAEEGKLPPGLERCAMRIAAEDFHQLLAHSRMVLSEGASTASEAACLGVPSVYINNTEPRGYLKLLEEQYGLVWGFDDAEQGIQAARELLARVSDDSVGGQFSNLAAQLDEECLDLVEYVVQRLFPRGGEC
jgi:predicted glycosyltransferase